MSCCNATVISPRAKTVPPAIVFIKRGYLIVIVIVIVSV